MTDKFKNNSLAPPAVRALRAEEGSTDHAGSRVQMERTISMDMREEREELKEAAEQTLNVILDLDLDGVVKWVSPSWLDVIGTPPDTVQGRPLSDILIDNKTAFREAVDSMKKDDSRSQIVRFSVIMGPSSRLRSDQHEQHDEEESTVDVLNLEAQGIMVYDRSTGGESHTMWMIRPSVQPRQITIDLPPLLVESLGLGAEMLAHYLTALAEVGANDPANNPPPLPVLCRICERQITPWWFEKHTELCMQEHMAEMEVQLAQEALTEHRTAIVKVLDALEVRSSRSGSGELQTMATANAEYKGMAIGPPSTPSSGSASGTSSPSPAGAPVRSRDSSTTRPGHSRAKSFAIRRSPNRIVELLLDLCDTALEISTPAIKDTRKEGDDNLRTQSPQSESRIHQVLQWQTPSTNTLDQEQGLAILCADTEAAAKAKVDAVIRHRRIIEYAERIRLEFNMLVQDCIDAAMQKAARIAAGELSDSTEEAEEETMGEDHESDRPSETHDDIGIFPASFEGPSSLAQAFRNMSDPALVAPRSRRASSAAISTGSNSPRGCPTPRSHQGSMNLLGQSQPFSSYKRGSFQFESDAGDSDSSVRSFGIGARRTESPASDYGLGRGAGSRDRSRANLVLPGSRSPRRQPSPARNGPSSPLRISKPRLPHEAVPSPVTSPLLSGGDLISPAASAHHHRRQSSATMSDAFRAPVSPRLSSITNPQPRAVPPSIKDFEIIKPISKGAFGSVYLSKKKSTGDYYAIKVLKKADMVAKNQVTNVKAERAIMMWQGESDFVAKLYWTFASKEYLYLVMEYLNGGDCASLIKVLGGLPEDWAKKYIGEVVMGIEHLHSRGIVHRDLKPDNLLIDQKGHLKLTDFGLSRMGLVGRQKRALNSTPNESAPDIFKQGPFARAMSVASSRSTSFDFQGGHSPLSTPVMTPDLAGHLGQPSYFNLSRENVFRDETRRTSGQRSDSGASDTLHGLFRNFSLNESSVSSDGQRRTFQPDDFNSEDSSPDPYTLQQTVSHSSVGQHSTPPQANMLPPPMALFDPEDSNRRFVGTPDYLAPETINGIGQDEMSDWWSMGCILFEFLYGYPPFHGDSPDVVFENILARKIDWPSDEDCPLSPEAKDIMNRLMCLNPNERLGANKDEKFTSGGEEVRHHPFFAGLNWETLLEDQAEFVPAPQNPEDTEYFDSRGATLQSFAEELEDQGPSPVTTPGADYPERPHDALTRVRTQTQISTSKRSGLMPLSIPPHVRDGKSRRLSEPVPNDDFGSFTFKNLPVLEKANKDVIQKLRAEAMQAQAKAMVSSNLNQSHGPPPSLESSPIIPGNYARSVSASKGPRPSSPAGFSQAASSPSRGSQPSSPLLVSFTAGQHHERRKTSSTSSNLSHQSSNSLQPGSFFDMPRLPASVKAASTASSPIKMAKLPVGGPNSPGKYPPHRHGSISGSRVRPQTVSSQEGDAKSLKEPMFHHKRRSQVFDISPSSSDNEEGRFSALQRVRSRRERSRRMSQIVLGDEPVFRPLDVLICEDHPVSRMVMEKFLEKLQCRTITVSNGSEAMRYALSEVQFDIIMMEYKLPQINGADVARMIRDTKNANSSTPIVCVTGYLKELPASHHFDGLIEKPPTTSKLTEILAKFCQWRLPSPGQERLSSQAVISSATQQAPSRMDDSPSSASSGFARVRGAIWPGSSREDSISSSFFGDSESVMTEDVPMIISRQPTNEWGERGLGISEEPIVGPQPIKPMPTLSSQTSAPPDLGPKSPRKQRSAESIEAKRKSLEKKRHENAESGDDEDEELGLAPSRHRNPPTKRGSKLGTQMLRTNSRGSVISASEEALIREVAAESAASWQEAERLEPSAENQPILTPPHHPRPPEGGVKEIDMDATPKPGPQQDAANPEPASEATLKSLTTNTGLS